MVTVKSLRIYYLEKSEGTDSLYLLSDKKPKFSKDYGLRDQIQRSAVSVMTNQAEGFCREKRL